MDLLNNAGAGNGETVVLSPGASPEAERFRTLYVWGTFGGASVTVEVSPGNGAPWFDSGLVITEATVVNLELRAYRARAIVTGGSGPSISARLM